MMIAEQRNNAGDYIAHRLEGSKQQSETCEKNNANNVQNHEKPCINLWTNNSPINHTGDKT